MPAVLIVNPGASRVTAELTAAVERELAAAGPVETLLTERPRHAVELAANACATCERIYVFSGDGGFNEAVNGVEGDVALGFLPGGKTSVLTRALGLPRDPVECARVLARTARTRRISLGRVAWRRFGASEEEPSRRFAFASGVGLDAEVVRAVDSLGRHRTQRPGDLAFLRMLAAAVGRRRARFEPALTVLGRGRAAFAIVLNGDPYTYAGRVPVHAAREARFELGLDLFAPVRVRPAALAPLAWSALTGGAYARRQDVLAAHDVDELRVECDGPLPLHADGEDLGDVGEARFEAERGALNVLVG